MRVAERVDEVLRRQLGDGFDWNYGTNLTAKPGLELDSLDLVRLIMGLEEEFGLSIPDDAAPGFERVGDLVDYVEQRLALTPAMFA